MDSPHPTPAVDGGLSAAIERPVGRGFVFPLGAARARRRCALTDPPLGADVQAVYEASSRLALARRERRHTIGHLVLALVCVDPGVAWTLAAADVDRRALLDELATALPAPASSWPARVGASCGRRARNRQIVVRYQRRTGRGVVESPVLAGRL